MSGWGFLSKAEGFLERVLDEPSKDKLYSKKPSQKSNEDGTETLSKDLPAASRWQERLTRAASQFTSQESLNTHVQQSGPFGTAEHLPESDMIDLNLLPEESRTLADTENLALATRLTLGSQSAQAESLTELQRSSTFPANMPSYLASPELLVDDANLKHFSQTASRSTGVELLVPHLQPGLECSRSISPGESSDQPLDSTKSGQELLQMVETLQKDLRTCEARRSDESQASAERISSLEARLSYLSNEQIAANRELARNSGATFDQKLLAEKDERIALLLEEGDNLSKKEIFHLTNIRRLRSRVTELEGLIASSVKAIEKADDAGTTMKRENRTLTESLKRAETRIKELSKFENEANDLKRAKQAQAKTLVELKRQLADADETISQNVTIWTQLQTEKSKTEALQQHIAEINNKAEEAAVEHASALAKLQGQFDRLSERSQATTDEHNAEVARLESELEQIRATLEETTTGAAENSQTKLLRQVEALQTQQALARQNWARIEESLVLRCKHAEAERDELRLQEEEFRQRLRQSALQRKDIDEERSTFEARCKTLESSIKDDQDRISVLEKTILARDTELEASLESWRAEKEVLEASVETQVRERLELERRSYPHGMPQSPYLEDIANRSGFSFQKHVIDSPNSRTPEKLLRPGMGSRMSTQTSRMPTRRKISSTFMLDEMRSPPIGYKDEEVFSPTDHFGNLKAPTEVSQSTSVGASLGLMERVAANVRKLELETNILREDLARMTRQRDEARDECVELEGQAQRHRQVEQALNESLSANKRLHDKFDATLELLGEQTEENDQLKEDIQDIKKAFRETLQSSLGQS